MKIIKSTVFILIFTLVFTLGCTQKNKNTNVSRKNKQKDSKSTLDAKYNAYLLLMDEEQRVEFFKLTSNTQRDRFIENQGIKRKEYLERKLHKGMNMEEVSEVLGKPRETKVDLDSSGSETQWLYREFNGYRNVNYAISFKNEKLVGWDLWLY